MKSDSNTRILCVGVNYRAHVEEMGREVPRYPVVFVRFPSSLVGDGEPIVMDGEQTVAVCLAAPKATVVAIHMESLDHGTVSRKALRALAESNGISASRLLIPADGETITF